MEDLDRDYWVPEHVRPRRAPYRGGRACRVGDARTSSLLRAAAHRVRRGRRDRLGGGLTHGALPVRGLLQTFRGLSPCRAIDSFSRQCPSGWVPFTWVHLGQRAGRPAQGRSQNTQQQTRQKRRTTDAGPRTTAPRKTSIPTTTEQFQPLGRRPHGRLLLFKDLARSQGTRLMAVS